MQPMGIGQNISTFSGSGSHAASKKDDEGFLGGIVNFFKEGGLMGHIGGSDGEPNAYGKLTAGAWDAVF